MDLSKGSSSNSPCNLAIAPERFYLVGVGAIPYSPATFFRTHFLRFIFYRKSVANFSKLERLTQWIDEKGLDNKVKADKTKCGQKFSYFLTALFKSKERQVMTCPYLFYNYKISFCFCHHVIYGETKEFE